MCCLYRTSLRNPKRKLFYRYCHLKKRAGRKRLSPAASHLPGGLAFRKDGCELNVVLRSPGRRLVTRVREGEFARVTLALRGQLRRARWLPKISAIDSKSSWNSFSSVTYRTKADLTDC